MIQLATGQEGPRGIAVDEANVYWVSYAGTSVTPAGSVMKIAKGGGSPSALATGQAWPFAVKVDATHVYWTNQGNPNDNPHTGALMQVALAGGIPGALASGLWAPADLALDGSAVYFTDTLGGGVMKVSLVAPGAAQRIVGGQDHPFGIAIGAELIWTSSGSCSGMNPFTQPAVKKADLSGGNVFELAPGDHCPQFLTVDGMYAYWSDQGSSAQAYRDGSIHKVALSGGTNVTLAFGQAGPAGIAVDDQHVYWVNYWGGTVMRTDKSGQNLTTLASSQGFPYGIAIDGSHVYWTAESDGTIMNVAK